MRILKIGSFILLGILAFSACEKDDICIDADTPRLVIRFYDAEDTTEFKEVPNLIVRGIGPSGLLDTIVNAALDSIELPLRTDQISTSFALRQTTLDTTNVDTLRISYQPKEIFKSRACGFIVNYEELEATAQPDDTLWIQRITIDTTTISNSFSAHVKIFH